MPNKILKKRATVELEIAEDEDGVRRLRTVAVGGKSYPAIDFRNIPTLLAQLENLMCESGPGERDSLIRELEIELAQTRDFVSQAQAELAEANQRLSHRLVHVKHIPVAEGWEGNNDVD